MYIRIIPRLDIKGPNLVKGIHLEGLRILGKPEWFAKKYYRAGADELLFQDVVASLYQRNSLYEIIKKTASEIFIPLTVGGGIRSVDDIRSILRSGADKVSINTAAVKNPKLIMDAANIFGSSTIVIAIEAIRQPGGEYLAFTDNGREKTGLEVSTWAKKAQSLGAGEIILTSVDREGTGDGMDLELIKLVSNSVRVPVVAHGGVGKISDIKEGLINGSSAISMASILHYYLLKGDDISTHSYSKVKTTGIKQIKKYLLKNHIQVRV